MLTPAISVAMGITFSGGASEGGHSVREVIKLTILLTSPTAGLNASMAQTEGPLGTFAV